LLLKYRYENRLKTKYFFKYYGGSYDFYILSKYLKYSFSDKEIIIDNKKFVVKDFVIKPEISNLLSNTTELENENEYQTLYKLYIILYNENNSFNIKEIEFSEFINNYGQDFTNKYYSILKTIDFDIGCQSNTYTICFDICYFCDSKENKFLVESDTGLCFYTCKNCEFFANYCINKVKNKYLFSKLRKFSKIIGKLLLYYYSVVEKRYLPGNIGFYESKSSFENKLKF
jgi:hypothetical protein